MKIERRSFLGWLAMAPVGASLLRWRPPRQRLCLEDIAKEWDAEDGDFVFDVAKGRAVELVERVRRRDPADCALEYIVIRTGTSDNVLRRCRTIAELLDDERTEEVRTGNYSRQCFTSRQGIDVRREWDGSVSIDLPDITWPSIANDLPWTDLVIAYAPNWMENSDRDLIPLTQHNFEVWPDGSHITAELSPAGFMRSN